MKQRRSLILGLAILCSSMTSQAANLILDLGNGNTVPYLISTARDVSISPGTGNITLRLVANSGTLGDGWCPPGTPPAGPVVSFSLSASSVTVGQSVTATWSTSSDATSCTGTGSTLPGTVANWGSSLALSGNNVALTLPIVGSYNFKLSCTGPTGTTVVDRAVSATAIIPPDDCAGINPIPGTTRLTVFANTGGLRTDGNTEWVAGTNLSTLTYTPVWGVAFPARTGTGAIPLLNGQYAAMQFSTGSSSGSDTPWGGSTFGQLLWTASQVNSGGTAMVSISRCPGDFNLTAPTGIPNVTKCYATGNSGSVGFTLGLTGSRCPLELNHTYYYNIAFFNQQGEQTCGNNLCHFFGQPQ